MRQRETEKLFNGLTGISEELIVEAQTMSLQKKKQVWPKIVAAAAVVLIIANRLFFPGSAPASKGPAEIPPLGISEAGVGKMMGLVVYQGKIYTDTEQYYDEDTVKIRPLLGDRLGWVLGDLDEWSTPSDYAKEFASSMRGEVYTVKGYSPDFRLCVVEEHGYEKGREMSVITFVEQLNGITLERGADLFEDRLKMRGRVAKVEYQSPDDQNWGRKNYKELPADPRKQLDAFFEEISAGRFEYQPDIYWDPSSSSAPRQGHLFFHLSDQTRIHLRLFEGGFVGYQGLFGYFVKIPSEVFDPIFEAIQ